MNSDWRNQLAYKDFKSRVVQDPTNSYKPIEFTGFEWPESKSNDL